MPVRLSGALFVSFLAFAAPPSPAAGPQTRIPLVVPAGVPLRLYLTRRVPKRAGVPVEAKLLEAVYVFDREVVPAGTRVLGRVAGIRPVSKGERRMAVLNGDFTPLHVAQIEFTSLLLPDGRQIPIHTVESAGLNSIVPLHPPKQKKTQQAAGTRGIIGAGKQAAKDQIHGQIDRVKSIPDIVRAPGRKERLTDFLMSKLPYHPQYVRNGTRFDAELRDPLSFGSEPVDAAALSSLGSEPAPDSLVHARLLTPLDSATSRQGEAVHAVLSQPLFSADHKLVLPEGTHLDGTVVRAQKARWFHRSGHLRFNFQNVELPPEVAQLDLGAPAPAAIQPAAAHQTKLEFRTEASLKAAESSHAPVKVDKEGGVQAKESKKRFIGTAVAVMLARRAGDNDPIRAKGTHTVIGQDPNVAGRTIGGGFGFGLLGAAVAQSSRWVGAAFGYYGMAWAVYSTVIARGSEVEFDKDAVLDIGFNTRQPAAPSSSKFASGQ